MSLCVCIELVIFITVLMFISKDITLEPLSHCGLFILNSLFFFFCPLLERVSFEVISQIQKYCSQELLCCELLLLMKSQHVCID